MQLTFGAGEFFAQMTKDASGNTIAVPNPLRIAGLQELSISFDGELKEYYGQNRFSLASAMGKVKVGGKIKGALVNGYALNNLFFGNTMTGGTMKAIVADTTGTAVPSTPYTITPTPPNSGTFVEDMGVVGSDGVMLTKVASAPTIGQYSVSGGVYTFAAADTAKTMYISYSYTYTSTNAKKISLDNLAMGNTPLIKATYATSYGGKRAILELNAITCTKLMLFAGKNDDFSVPELDFSAQTDATGFSLGSLYVQE